MGGLSTGNGFPNVVVTGIAMTTALATDADSTWQKLRDRTIRHEELTPLRFKGKGGELVLRRVLWNQ